MSGRPVPEWCRPGAPAVITDGSDDPLGMWRAVQITDVTDDRVYVQAVRPYRSQHEFALRGADERPVLAGRNLFGPNEPVWQLAPADAPDVIAQRQRRDEAKHPGTGPSDWELTDEGWRLR